MALAGCATGEDLRQASRRGDDRAAQLGAAIQQLRDEVARLRTEVGEVRSGLEAWRADAEAQRRDDETRERTRIGGVERENSATGRQVAELARSVADLEASVAGLAEQVVRLEAVSPPSIRSPRVPPGPAGSPEELYQRGMDSLRRGDLGQAVLDLEEFVVRHPSHAWAPAAQLAIGDAYFRAREYRQAVVEYQKAVDLAPTGDQAPEALYRLGLTWRGLRQEDRAREAWGRLQRDFPESEAARRARSPAREAPRPARPAAPGESRPPQ